MIQTDSNSSKKIKENKYKILRMSLLLGQEVDKNETINNFEDAAIEIDSMNNETYNGELEQKFYETSSLEEERDRLTELVDYIAGRISQRESLLSDFINVTGRRLTGLNEIKYENKLTDYQERLKYINEYLNNTKKIEDSSSELQILNDKLNKEEHLKETNEEENSKLEKLLLEKFKDIVNGKIEIENLDEENIQEKLADLISSTEESKKSLDIFSKSFTTLKNAGISYEDEMEYKSYVTSARDIYYEFKEQVYLLSVYELLLTSETEYTKIYNKRENINNILNERIELRNSLGLSTEDCLDEIYNILSHQNEIVEGQKDNIDNISQLKSKIKYIEERIEELKEDNEKVEILALLKEYNIIDTYEEEQEEIEIPTIDIPTFDDTEEKTDNEKVEDVEEKQEDSMQVQEESTIENNSVTATEELKEEPKEESKEESKEIEIPINKPYKNNFIMGSHDPLGLNVDECITKANTVMKRVGEMLKIVPKEEQKEQNSEEHDTKIEISQPELPQIEKDDIKKEENPFIETNEKEKSEPAAETEKEIPVSTEESNVKNVLPSADSFWNNPVIEDDKDDNTDIPELTVSNDDFFANNMDNFEFPNLDEFK